MIQVVLFSLKRLHAKIINLCLLDAFEISESIQQLFCAEGELCRRESFVFTKLRSRSYVLSTFSEK